jgi:hypothetical protein
MLDTTTNQRGRQAAHQAIPNPCAPNTVTVTGGQTTTGTIAERDRSFFAFDAASVLIGESTRDQAVSPNWLIELFRRKPSISERAVAAMTPPTDSSPGSWTKAYGSAALDREIAALAATAPGVRNHALNRTAFRLSQLVAGGELGDAEVFHGLIDACRRNGLIDDDGERSVRATIRSAAIDAAAIHRRGD